MNDLAEFIREFLKTHHRGRGNGISCEELAVRARCKPRQVRLAITELREAGVPVCGHPNAGYYLAENAEELEETCQFLRSRALHSLNVEAKLRGKPLAELVGQLGMELESSHPGPSDHPSPGGEGKEAR